MISILLGMNTLMAEPLSLQESLELVATQNPEVQIARLQADQSNLERLKVLTNLVTVQASGSWLDFGEPLDSYIIGDGSEEVDCSSFDAFGFGDLCASFSEPLRVRDERIFDGSIQVAIPISALYSIIEGHSASQHMQLPTVPILHQHQRRPASTCNCRRCYRRHRGRRRAWP